MKVLTVNAYDIEGGAARAAYRLHKGLQSIGVESCMLVQFKSSDESTIIAPVAKLHKAIARLRQWLDTLPLSRYRSRSKSLFTPALVPFSDLISRINSFDADIVHLHWLGSGILHIDDLLKINKPVVWSLHDMWAFTGGCHYNESCNRYNVSCCECPVLGSHSKNDLSSFCFKHKNTVYKKIRSHLTIVGLSHWMADAARNSALLKDIPVVTLPNPIDLQRFYPIEKQQARNILNLPSAKKFILFGAMTATGDSRKGYKELLAALPLLADKKNIACVVFGSSKPHDAPEVGMEVHYLGQLSDDITLQIVYSAIDVMVVPSLQENLSNIIMESLACATPVVGFDVGGNRDLIDHQKNGYLARPFEPESLAAGIEWVLNHQKPLEIAANARQKVVDCFAMEKVSRQYQSLYEDILKNYHKPG